MRIALVSPYSWTYPGGVTRHIEALAERSSRPGTTSACSRRSTPTTACRACCTAAPRPQRAPAPGLPDPARPHGRLPRQRRGLEPVGRRRTAVARCAASCAAAATTSSTCTSRSRRCSAGTRCARRALPLVGTFHCLLDEPRLQQRRERCSARGGVLNHLHVRIAVSEAAAWTGAALLRRALPDRPQRRRRAGRRAPRRDDAGRAAADRVRRPGGRAQGAAGAAARVRGAARARPGRADGRRRRPRGGRAAAARRPRHRRVLGRVDDAEKQRVLERADVLCAPSLGGESFGMVLTEAFAAGTPVVASDIAGYRDVVRDGVDGVLVPRGDATALAETLRDLWLEPARRAAMGAAAAERAERFAWPHVAARGARRLRGRDRDAGAAGRARSAPPCGSARARPTCSRACRAQRLPSLEPPPPARRARAGARARAPRRRCSRSRALALAGTVLAFRRIGVARDRRSRCSTRAPRGCSPAWASCAPRWRSRAVAWHAILAGRAPAGARAPARRDAGHVHRRADVGDAAGAPRRALARADRRAPHRPPARAPAGRARHDRLADAAEHRSRWCCSAS